MRSCHIFALFRTCFYSFVVGAVRCPAYGRLRWSPHREYSCVSPNNVVRALTFSIGNVCFVVLLWSAAHHRQPVRPTSRRAHSINREEDAYCKGWWHHDVRCQEAQGDNYNCAISAYFTGVNRERRWRCTRAFPHPWFSRGVWYMSYGIPLIIG